MATITYFIKTVYYYPTFILELSRVAALPRLSRHIEVECNVTTVREPLDSEVRLQLRDRRRNKYDFTGDADAVIVKGAKIYFHKNGNNMKIWSIGPTLAEIIISVRKIRILFQLKYPRL